MKNIHPFLNFWALILLIGFSQMAYAQSDKELLAQVAAENQMAVNALVLYPQETRQSILEATLYPEALIKLESIQKTTSESFKNLVEQYPQETQETIWDLTRYPELIPNLVQLGFDQSSEVDLLTNNYPEIIHSRIWDAYSNHFTLLVRINELQQSANRAFGILLSDYPGPAQEAFSTLIDLPEVLTLLTENIRLSILVGDLYRADPEWLLHKTDSLNMVVARQNAQELEDWQESLKEDPEAKQELETSAKEFAEANAYDDLYYDGEEAYANEAQTQIVEYHYYHYPFWFGYPYWYTHPRWRPYPVWYDWGFYFYPDRRISVVYLPSYYFIDWYFRYPHHHYRHPRLSAHFIRYYQRHPRSNNSICNNVYRWQNSNKKIITDDFLKPDRDLVNRVKEYGKFESERVTYNTKNRTNPKSPTEFLEQNRRKYPALEKTVPKTKPEVATKRPTTVSPKPQPNTKPRTVTPPKSEVPKTKPEVVPKRPTTISPKPQPNTKLRTVTPPKSEVPKTKPAPVNRQPVPKVEEAKKYHESTWEKSRQKQVPRTSPQVPTPSTKKSTPVRKPRTSPTKSNRKNR